MRRIFIAAALLILSHRIAIAEATVEEEGSPDWVEAKVWQVVDTPGGGGIVLLRTAGSEGRAVPIAIGNAEALAIRIKLAGMSFARPLTHDLLDRLVATLGGKVIKVRIEKLEALAGGSGGGTFFGRVFVRQGKRQFDLDARASDSIAVALRAKVPIYVAKAVVESTGLDPKQFEDQDDAGLPVRKLKQVRPPSEPL